MESAVTRLLLSVKELLESLTKWSEQQITEMDVSDVYVQLGNNVQAAVAAFAVYDIEMKLVSFRISPPFHNPSSTTTETHSRSIGNSILFPKTYEASWRPV